MIRQVGTGRQVVFLLALSWVVFAATFATLEPGVTVTTSFLVLLQLGFAVLHLGWSTLSYFRKGIGLGFLTLNAFLNPVLLLIVLFASVAAVPGLRRSLEYQGIDRVRDTALVLDQTVAALDILDVDDLPRDPRSLAAAIAGYGVDLNSCKLTDEGIEDSWGNPIQVVYDPALTIWTLRSSGEDEKLPSADDIVRSSRAR